MMSEKEEEQLIISFFENTNIPSYLETLDLIQSINGWFQVEAEWGEFNWCLFNEIWNKDFNDEKKLRIVGERIIERGGLHALQMNYYAVTHIAETIYSNKLYNQDDKFIIKSCISSLLKIAFNGLKDEDGNIWRN